MAIDESLVSVVISAYNHEKFVAECISSIISQTYKNIELLIIDDGSKDNTYKEILKLKFACENRFENFYYATQKNQGFAKTLNKLIDQAKGAYIYIIASDDVAKPKAIESLYSFLSKHPDYVEVVGDDEFINNSSEVIGLDKDGKPQKLELSYYKTLGDLVRINKTCNEHPNFGEYCDLLRRNYIPNGYLIRRSSLLQCGKYDPNILLEDWYIHLQLAKLGKIKYLENTLFSYRVHEHNTISSSSLQKKMPLIVFQVYCHERKYCVKHGLNDFWTVRYKKIKNKLTLKAILKLKLQLFIQKF